MAVKKRSIKKPKTVIREHSAQRLAVRYEELLRLRQAVRLAELVTGRARVAIDLQNNRTYVTAH